MGLKYEKQIELKAGKIIKLKGSQIKKKKSMKPMIFTIDVGLSL